MHRHLVHAALALAGAVALGVTSRPAPTPAAAAIKKGAVEQITVHGKSLEGEDASASAVFVAT
jgi:hypothetical protein